MGAIADIAAGLTTPTGTPFAEVGQRITVGKCTYQYIQYQASASVLAVAGSPLGFRTADLSTVTTDISLSSSSALMGVAMGTHTSTKRFGWALVVGRLSDAGITAKTDTNVAITNKLAWAADKVFTGRTAAHASTIQYNAIGYASAADSGSQLVAGVIGSTGGPPTA